MCTIANFDFFANPFIPGQPIKYYEKFLKPIHDVLAEFKYVWNNYFIYLTDFTEYYSASLNSPVESIDALINSASTTTRGISKKM